MPYHDLNVPFNPNFPASHLSTHLSFASTLNYSTIALTLEITGKLPKTFPRLPTTQSHPFLPQNLTLLTRLTLTISDPTQNHLLANINSKFSLLALRPANDKSLSLCCHSLDCDIISIDFSARLPFLLHHTTLMAAVRRGIRFEISYSPGIVGSIDQKRNLISGATSLIRATRGRGIIIGSGARDALGMRGPADVMNLVGVWGLGPERAKEAVCEEPAKVVEMARLKREMYRGVVGVVDQGIVVDNRKKQENGIVDEMVLTTSKATVPNAVLSATKIAPSPNTLKRKASNPSPTNGTTIPNPHPQQEDTDKSLSKRAKKKLAKQARLDDKSGPSEQASSKNGSDFEIPHETLKDDGEIEQMAAEADQGIRPRHGKRKAKQKRASALKKAAMES